MGYKKVNFEKLINSSQLKSDVNFIWLDKIDKGVFFHLKSGTDLLVRRMEVNDVPAVLEIERASFSSPWSDTSFFYRLHDRNFNVSLVGYIREKLVAYAVSYVISDEFHIANIAVHKDFRRHGIGKVLIWLSLHIGIESNCTVSHLEVRRTNISAIRLYESFGFEIYSVRKNYYEHEKEDALLMKKEINWELPYGMV